MMNQFYFVLCLADSRTFEPQKQVLSYYANRSLSFIDYSEDFDPNLMMKFTDYGQALDFVGFAWSLDQTILIVAAWNSLNPTVIECPYAKTRSPDH